MAKTYNVTGKNLVDAVTYTISANSKREAISQARKRAARSGEVYFSRMDGRVKWLAEVGE